MDIADIIKLYLTSVKGSEYFRYIRTLYHLELYTCLISKDFIIMETVRVTIKTWKMIV